jgi:outer membrane protein TolC
MKYFLIHITLLLYFIQQTNAQVEQMSNSAIIILPSLDNIINAALQHSPLLKAKRMEAAIIEQEVRIEKKKWTNNVYLDGAANYGLFDQVVLSGTSTDGALNSGLLTKSEQIRYYGGVSIKIPFSVLSSRRNEINKKNFAIKQSDYEKMQIQKEIKSIIIEEYYNLKYFEESMKTFQAIYQTLQIAYLKAETDVLNNNLDLNHFALLASTVGKAKNDFLKAKNDFYSRYYQLQNIAGIIFETK